MKLYKDHPDMVKGDDYTRWKDSFEILIVFFAILGIPVLFTEFWFIEVGIISTLFLLHLPLALDVLINKNIKIGISGYLLYIPLLSLRSFVRFSGMRHILILP